MTSTPSSQALTKRESDQILMPPPPPPKRIKRPATVLDEDVYTNALSEIIVRDFFPGLLEIQIKQEYLDALDSKNKEWIAAARKKLTDVMTTSGRTRGMGGRGNRRVTPGLTTPGHPDQTPIDWGGDTPSSTISATTQGTSATTATQRQIPDTSNLGLVAFQAKYTSEDNESFNKLLDKQNSKRREKYAWLWNGNKIPMARQLAHRQRETKRITAQGGNPDKGEEQKQKHLIKTDLDARPAKPELWKTRPENSLMFIPSSIEDTHETIQQRAEASSRAGPKRVLYQNTRLRDSSTVIAEEAHATSVPPSPSISAIKDAIAGNPRHTDSEAAFTGETPRINGYAFVDEDEPEAERNHRGQEDHESSLFDLRLLGTGDSTPNPFQIREVRKREDLHHRMVDRVARTRRAEKAAREIKTPVPRFPSSPKLDFGLRTPNASRPGSNVKALTPAAQKLLHKVGSTPRSSGMVPSSSGLRNMWTPTPKKTK